jgi:hypothetical protein
MCESWFIPLPGANTLVQNNCTSRQSILVRLATRLVSKIYVTGGLILTNGKYKRSRELLNSFNQNFPVYQVTHFKYATLFRNHPLTAFIMKLTSIVAVLAGTAIAGPIASPQRYGDRYGDRYGGPPGPGLLDAVLGGVGTTVSGVFGGLLDGVDAIAGTAVDLLGDLLSIPGDLLDAIGLKRAWTEKDTNQIKEMRAALAPIIQKYQDMPNQS